MHNLQTRAIAKNHATFVARAVACSFGLGLYFGTYKRIDQQNTGLIYENFCSILQYTIKSKETINSEFKRA